jgi:hypothetical protein
MDGTGRATVRGGETEQRPRSDRTLGLASPTKESACFCWTALAELRASERASDLGLIGVVVVGGLLSASFDCCLSSPSEEGGCYC